jgi:hypothetical protein
MAITPTSNWIDVASRLQICLSDINSWMCCNFLKINQEKLSLLSLPQNTEFIILMKLASILREIELKSHHV